MRSLIEPLWREGWAHGLQFRLAGLAISLVVSTAVVIGVMQFRLNTAEQIEREGERMQAKLRLAEKHLADVVQSASQKLALLAATPPIEGMIRAERAGGVDPLDGSTFEMWKDRLAQIFTGVVKYDPDVLQVRYIGGGPDAKEIVRVHRRRGKIEIVKENLLQRKGGEAYVDRTLALEPAAVHIFDVNLNREYGVIENPQTPVLRVATPVYFEGKAAAGLVVINIEFNSVLKKLERVFGASVDFYLANAHGDFLKHKSAEKTFGFDKGRRFLIQDEFPEVARFLGSASRFGNVFDHQRLSSVRRLAFDPRNPERHFLAAAFVPADTLLSTSFASRAAIFALVALLVLINTVLAVLIARRMVKPLKQLTSAADELKRGAAIENLEIPTGRPDEVGLLAEAFLDMAKALQQRQVQLAETNQSLLKSNAQLRDFAHIASHDLREPIRATCTHASMLMDLHGDQFSESVSKRLERICALSKRMESITTNLLEYSKLDTPQSREQVETAILIDEITTDLRELIEEKDAKICVQHGLSQAFGNKPQLRIVFQNLIINGLKYNSSPRKRIEIGSTERLRPDGVTETVFSVRDNGVGMDAAQAEDAFRLFRRLHRDDEFGHGAGIGLTFVKRVVENLGGELWVKSELGAGSVFYFSNPGASRSRAEGTPTLAKAHTALPNSTVTPEPEATAL